MANDTIHAMAVKTDGALERDFEMLFNFITLCLVPDDFEIKELRAEYKRSAMLGDEIVPRVTIESDSITVVLTAIDGSEYAAVQFISV